MEINILDDEAIKGVVEHMNSDHKDACLAIVQALSDSGAVESRMLWMNSSGVDFSIKRNTGEETQVHVDFIKPITRDAQIRGHMVALTKRARALLGQ